VRGFLMDGGGMSGLSGMGRGGRDRRWMTTWGDLSLPAHGKTTRNFPPAGGALSPASTGFEDPNLDNPLYMAIDPSGNVWVTNNAASSVTEFIGPATPVQTPLNGPATEP